MASCAKPNAVTARTVIQDEMRGRPRLQAKDKIANALKCANQCDWPEKIRPADGTKAVPRSPIVNATAQASEMRRKLCLTEFNNAVFDGVLDKFCIARYIKFLENPIPIGADRAGTKTKLFRNFLYFFSGCK